MDWAPKQCRCSTCILHQPQEEQTDDVTAFGRREPLTSLHSAHSASVQKGWEDSPKPDHLAPVVDGEYKPSIDTTQGPIPRNHGRGQVRESTVSMLPLEWGVSISTRSFRETAGDRQPGDMREGEKPRLPEEHSAPASKSAAAAAATVVAASTTEPDGRSGPKKTNATKRPRHLGRVNASFRLATPLRLPKGGGETVDTK